MPLDPKCLPRFGNFVEHITEIPGGLCGGNRLQSVGPLPRWGANERILGVMGNQTESDSSSRAPRKSILMSIGTAGISIENPAKAPAWIGNVERTSFTPAPRRPCASLASRLASAAE